MRFSYTAKYLLQILHKWRGLGNGTGFIDSDWVLKWCEKINFLGMWWIKQTQATPQNPSITSSVKLLCGPLPNMRKFSPFGALGQCFCENGQFNPCSSQPCSPIYIKTLRWVPFVRGSGNLTRHFAQKVIGWEYFLFCVFWGGQDISSLFVCGEFFPNLEL